MDDILSLTMPAVAYRQTGEIAPAFVNAIKIPRDKQQIKQKLVDIQDNIRQQVKEVREYAHHQHGALPDCCKTLHLSLFFDGTNNHRIPDVPGHTLSNVARLYRATIGPDPASETATSPAAQAPTGLTQQLNKEGYYAYYASGVGTVFEPVNDNTPSQSGLIGAYKGEARINWMLTRIVDALYTAFEVNKEPTLNFASTRNRVEAMDTGSMLTYPLTQIFVDGTARRKEQIDSLLNNPVLQEKLAIQHEPNGNSTQPKILSMRLYVYGFSRGAAEARTFCNWLQELLVAGTTVTGEPCLTLAGIPVIIEFLGLFDTVPAVGLANSFPFATGHMAWADLPYMRIPDDSNYVKKCLHLVAAHEQRASFAVDSIRRRDLNAVGEPTGYSIYRADTEEYVYPGVHSDIGGGYAPNDQGKGVSDEINSHELIQGKEVRYISYNLSQLALHHMYREAFKVGAPLKIDKLLINKLPKQYQEKWRALNFDSILEFGIHDELIQHFNGWRQHAASYHGQPVEDIIKRETALITAWRISRYNPAQIKEFNFFKRLPNDVSEEYWAAAARMSGYKIQLTEATRIESEKAVKENRAIEPCTYENTLSKRDYAQYQSDKALLENAEPPIIEEDITPYKVYEPMLDQRQIYRGALDFYSDYEGVWDKREDPSWQWMDMVLESFIGLMYLLNEDDEAQEYLDILRESKAIHQKIFIDGTDDPHPEYVDLIKLFDNQVHDSRAWFMNSTKGFENREPATSYFTYRRIQLGNDSNKPMTPVVIASKIVGLAVVAGSVIMSVKRKNAKYLALLLAPTLFNPLVKGRLSLPYPDFLTRSAGPDISYTDALTGITLPMVAGATQAMTYTTSMAAAMTQAAMLPEPVLLTADNAQLIPNGEYILNTQAAVNAKKAADINAAFTEMLSAEPNPLPVKASSFLDQLADKAGINLVGESIENSEPKQTVDKANMLKQIIQLDSDTLPAYKKDSIIADILDNQPSHVAELLKHIPANEWTQHLKAIGMI